MNYSEMYNLDLGLTENQINSDWRSGYRPYGVNMVDGTYECAWSTKAAMQSYPNKVGSAAVDVIALCNTIWKV